MHRVAPLLVLFLLVPVGSITAAGAPPRVAVSIAPLHSIVAAVAGDRVTPHLIVPPGQSPHTFSLAPSDAHALSRAALVVTSGGAADRFLERALASLAGDAVHLRLLDTPGVTRLPARSGGAWQDDSDARAPSGAAAAADGPGVDPHAWLDPRNAIAFAGAIADALGALDPADAQAYHERAAALAHRLSTLDQSLARDLAPVRDRPYVVFHDAYQYFERRYDLSPIGSIVVDPGRPPGARRLVALRNRITAAGVGCLFVEPQFEPRIAHSVTADSSVRVRTLDPLGAGLDPGPGLYPGLLRRMAGSLRDCLGES